MSFPAALGLDCAVRPAIVVSLTIALERDRCNTKYLGRFVLAKVRESYERFDGKVVLEAAFARR